MIFQTVALVFGLIGIGFVAGYGVRSRLSSARRRRIRQSWRASARDAG